MEKMSLLRPLQHLNFPFNMTGHPSASILCGWSSENTPIGMEITAKRFEDLKVLQVVKAFKDIAP